MDLRAPYSIQVALQAYMLATQAEDPGDIAQEMCARVWLRRRAFSIHVVAGVVSAFSSVFCAWNLPEDGSFLKIRRYKYQDPKPPKSVV